MAVKTITITTKAYEAIKRMKRADESFSELFLRIAPARVDARSLYGMLKDNPKELAAIKKSIREGREKDVEEEKHARS
jgi:predicted CopG family antitoxin